MPGNFRENKRNCFVTFVMLLLWALCSTVSYAATDEQINESVNKGTQWLIQAQNPDGNWGNNTKKDILDTAEIAKYLVESGQAPLSVDRAVYWLQSQDPSNSDFSARIMPFMTMQANDETLATLIDCQNPDGGWGLAEGYDSDILDTVIVLNSLLKDNRVDTSIIQNGLAFIIRNQNSDGSWSYVKNGTGSVSTSTTDRNPCRSSEISGGWDSISDSGSVTITIFPSRRNGAWEIESKRMNRRNSTNSSTSRMNT
jgi:prenyltransferase beta subunit